MGTKGIKFRFLTKISIFDQNFDFWSKFGFLTKISIFDQNFYIWPKFRFLIKIWIFDQSFDFWPKFRFLTKISIFDQNFDFWSKFRFLTKIPIFYQHFDFLHSEIIFWPQNLTENNLRGAEKFMLYFSFRCKKNLKIRDAFQFIYQLNFTDEGIILTENWKNINNMFICSIILYSR